MTLRRRLYNIARAELEDVARRVRASAEDLLGTGGRDRSEPDEFENRLSEEEMPPREPKTHRGSSQHRAGGQKGSTTARSREDALIRRYYANLELPIGATSLEVKAAYRRLMRRYHPDLHQEDRQKAEIANQLALELRTAYEALLAYLERQGR